MFTVNKTQDGKYGLHTVCPCCMFDECWNLLLESVGLETVIYIYTRSTAVEHYVNS